MFVAVSAVVPLFLLVLLGFAIRRASFMTAGGTEGLAGFVFYVAVPALLFRTAGRGLDIDSTGIDFVGAYYIGTVLVFILGGCVARFGLILPHGEQAVFGMSCAYGNTVLLGIPLISTLYGPDGLAAITLIVSLQALILLPLTTSVVELGKLRRLDWRLAGAALRSAVVNPIVLSILAGFGLSAIGFGLPPAASRGIDMLAAAATPCALVALGAKLVTEPKGGQPQAETATALVVGIKLLVHPAVVWLLATQVMDVRGELARIALLTAALPVGATAYTLAQAQHLVPERAARAVAISSVLSLVTLTILVALVGPASVVPA